MGWTQDQLGKIFGMSREWAVALEQGKISLPAQYVPHVANILGVSIRKLYSS